MPKKARRTKTRPDACYQALKRKLALELAENRRKLNYISEEQIPAEVRRLLHKQDRDLVKLLMATSELVGERLPIYSLSPIAKEMYR